MPNRRCVQTAMKIHNFQVYLEPEPEGGFTVTVPSLPGCVTWGKNHDHAIAMAREAIEGCLEVLAEEGKDEFIAFP
jgi:antitoxin HicB